MRYPASAAQNNRTEGRESLPIVTHLSVLTTKWSVPTLRAPIVPSRDALWARFTATPLLDARSPPGGACWTSARVPPVATPETLVRYQGCEICLRRGVRVVGLAVCACRLDDAAPAPRVRVSRGSGNRGAPDVGHEGVLGCEEGGARGAQGGAELDEVGEHGGGERQVELLRRGAVNAEDGRREVEMRESRWWWLWWSLVAVQFRRESRRRAGIERTTVAAFRAEIPVPSKTSAVIWAWIFSTASASGTSSAGAIHAAILARNASNSSSAKESLASAKSSVVHSEGKDRIARVYEDADASARMSATGRRAAMGTKISSGREVKDIRLSTGGTRSTPRKLQLQSIAGNKFSYLQVIVTQNAVRWVETEGK
ncbi:hypothetical protein M427DRAFT_148802, partial [Gonapodya prolifera JEL478]